MLRKQSSHKLKKIEGTTDELKSKQSEYSSEITTELKMNILDSEAISELESHNLEKVCDNFKSDIFYYFTIGCC